LKTCFRDISIAFHSLDLAFRAGFLKSLLSFFCPMLIPSFLPPAVSSSLRLGGRAKTPTPVRISPPFFRVFGITRAIFPPRRKGLLLLLPVGIDPDSSPFPHLVNFSPAFFFFSLKESSEDPISFFSRAFSFFCFLIRHVVFSMFF